MKKFNVRKDNYPTTFTWIKPDDYDDGELIKHSWYFSICDWMGNELDGTYQENELIQKIEEMQDKGEGDDMQVFAYPMIDNEEEVDYELRNVNGVLTADRVNRKEIYSYGY